MRKNWLLLLVCALIIMIPIKVQADENVEFEDEVITYKYYKTYHNLLNNNDTYSVEITEEEYEEVNPDITPYDNSVETTYKKLGSSITQNGSYYRYRAILEWKCMPSTRSHDIIAVGYASSVVRTGAITFKQTYRDSSGTDHTTTSGVSTVGNNGVGYVFALPTGTITKLKQDLYFNVTKNTTSTIIYQAAYADYAHATSTISQGNAQNYYVNTGGIQLHSSIYNYYDSINTAMSSWSGTW